MIAVLLHLAIWRIHSAILLQRLIFRVSILSIFLAAPALAQAPNAIHGLVKDASGSAVIGAVVNLKIPSEAAPRIAITGPDGAFRFSAVEPGNYPLEIAAMGFSPWTSTAHTDSNEPVSAVLEVASASSSVDVTLSRHELAAEQVKAAENQRLLGLFPDFFVSYDKDAPPLTVAQKFHLGWKTLIDPVVLADTGITAGIQQARDKYPEFGQGAEGYAKRYGARYADHVSGVLIGHVVMQAIFRQDPRYFYKGTGSFGSRALYAIGTAFVRKGDNGHWQPDYSDVLGGIASGEISRLYYPASSREGRRIVDNVLLGFGGRAAHNLLHEFVLRKLTPHATSLANGLPPEMLREGTPVSLISVDDWTSKTGPVTFILAGDIKKDDGVIVAPIGTKAWGQASFDSKGMHVGLDHVRLKIAETDVPLRSSSKRDGGEALEVRHIENSGRIAITLYVAENVALAPSH